MPRKFASHIAEVRAARDCRLQKSARGSDDPIVRTRLAVWAVFVANLAFAACSSGEDGGAAAPADDADAGALDGADAASADAAVAPTDLDAAFDASVIDVSTLDGLADAELDAGFDAGPTFAIGGSVTGLVGAGLVLEGASGESLAIDADGEFTLPDRLPTGASYAVTVKTNPSSPAAVCVVTNGDGVVADEDVSSVVVTCTTRSLFVAGVVKGLVGGGSVVLQNNGGDDVIVHRNGPFYFETAVESGTNYAVTIGTQPSSPPHLCTVARGAGTIGSSNVTDVEVDCVRQCTIGGTATGLTGPGTGTGLVLQNDEGDDITVDAAGAFEFPKPVPSGGAYSVTVLTQPTGPARTCKVTNGAGTAGITDVSDVRVSCSAPDLLAYYPFEEGSGTAVHDGSGHGFDGTHNAGYVAGKSGLALGVGAATGAIVPGNASFTWGANNADYTVDYWVNLTSANANWSSVFHKSDTSGANCCSGTMRTPAQFFKPGTTTLISVMGTVANGDHSQGTTAAFALGAWTHVACVHSGANQLLYVNGDVVVTDLLGSPTVGAPGIVYLGYDHANAGIAGAIDEVRIYTRALSQIEIQADMQ
jgi:hypothetical protein